MEVASGRSRGEFESGSGEKNPNTKRERNLHGKEGRPLACREGTKPVRTGVQEIWIQASEAQIVHRLWHVDK